MGCLGQRDRSRLVTFGLPFTDVVERMQLVNAFSLEDFNHIEINSIINSGRCNLLNCNQTFYVKILKTNKIKKKY